MHFRCVPWAGQAIRTGAIPLPAYPCRTDQPALFRSQEEGGFLVCRTCFESAFSLSVRPVTRVFRWLYRERALIGAVNNGFRASGFAPLCGHSEMKSDFIDTVSHELKNTSRKCQFS